MKQNYKGVTFNKRKSIYLTTIGAKHYKVYESDLPVRCAFAYNEAVKSLFPLINKKLNSLHHRLELLSLPYSLKKEIGTKVKQKLAIKNLIKLSDFVCCPVCNGCKLVPEDESAQTSSECGYCLADGTLHKTLASKLNS